MSIPVRAALAVGVGLGLALGSGLMTGPGLMVGLPAAVGQPPAVEGSASPGPSSPGPEDLAPEDLAPEDPAAPIAGPVLVPVGDGMPGAALDPDEVRAAVAPLLTGGPLGSGATPTRIVDAATGAVLLDLDAGHAVVPASTLKLVTAVSVLDALGADAVLRTRTVLAPAAAGAQGHAVDAGPRQVILVGAGDPGLTGAGLADLAGDTARALALVGSTEVTLGYDSTLFTGPSVHPSWSSGFPASGVVAPVSALAVDQGRRRAGQPARVGDPAQVAATSFAGLLAGRGVQVRGAPEPTRAPSGVTALAEHASDPIGVLVEHMLTTSDNDHAETLARVAAVAAGEEGSFEGVSRRGLAVLADITPSTTGLHVADGSGLSRDSRLTPAVLTDLLGDAEVGALTSIPAGLPVAAATGTLQHRYRSADTADGRGLVRAKTGTLTGVSGLAGYVSRPDGRLLVVALLDDTVPSGASAARSSMDRALAALVGCDCATG